MNGTAGWLMSSAIIALLVIGCGHGNGEISSGSGTSVSASPLEGVQKMIHTAAQLQEAIDAGDQKQVNTVGPQLETAWLSFEDKVKSSEPDDYAHVEQYLDPTVAGSKASQLDKTTLSSLDSHLMDALVTLQNKLK